MSFEESEKETEENLEYRRKIHDEEIRENDLESKERFQRRKRPEGITEKEWEKERKKLKRLKREEDKQYTIDMNLRFSGTPISMYAEKLNKTPLHLYCRRDETGNILSSMQTHNESGCVYDGFVQRCGSW